MNSYGVVSKIVWDGGPDIKIPSEMGTPRGDQLQGTVRERLSELAGRVCYDSCGTGRNSLDYHVHIKQVGHFSVYEHAHMTVLIRIPLVAEIFLNRPGLWIENRFEEGFRVTFNPRTVLEWDGWSDVIGVDDFVDDISSYKIGDVLAYHAEKAYPQVVTPRKRSAEMMAGYDAISAVVEPETGEEKWVSLFMVGSRGFSHELVRHGDRTAISQRSTRFVQESESPWIHHPLVQEFLKSPDVKPEDQKRVQNAIDGVINPARETYGMIVEVLQPWLTTKGADKLTARKQARGAARGYLGNALATEVVFSASVAQWKRMMTMRACAPADAEIRAVFVDALEVLLESRYGKDFTGFKLAPSPDGLGKVALMPETNG